MCQGTVQPCAQVPCGVSSNHDKRVELDFILFYIRRAYDQNRFGVCTSEAFSRCGDGWGHRKAEQKPPLSSGIRASKSGCFLFFYYKPTDIEKDVVHVR